MPGCVTVQDLHPEEWQAEEEADHATRTSYKTKDHTHMTCSYAFETGKTCTLFNVQSKNVEVSYKLRKHYYLTMGPTIGMLALNRQTRAEAIPLFYGKNEIYFTSMSAVLPFLKDRSELSLKSMHYFQFQMEVYRLKYQKRRSEGWAWTFAELPKFQSPKFQKLRVYVNDPECCYAWKLQLDTKLQRWVRELAKSITNLDMLGITFHFRIIGELTPNENVKEDGPTEELLWEFLAPKMLKKVGNGPHDAHSLLKRRIRDKEYQEGFSEDDCGLSRQSEG